MIEQERTIARDESVKNAQPKAASATRTSAGLSARVKQLHPDATMLADMLGSLAEEARYYAERSDESNRAGMTCERVYESVRVPNNRF